MEECLYTPNHEPGQSTETCIASEHWGHGYVIHRQRYG